MYESFALVASPNHERSLAAPRTGHAIALCGFAIAAAIAMGLFVAGMPVLSMCMLAVSGVSSCVVGSAVVAAAATRDSQRRGQVAPEDIASNDARATYRAIAIALVEVERALADAPRLGVAVEPVLERCRAAVAMAGRVALLTNPLQRYLDSHDAAGIRSELDRLRARAETASPAAAASLEQAITARSRQLAIHDQMVGKRDQLCARLEVVRAALDSFAAMIVKLHALGEEQLVLAGESVADCLDGVGEDLALLESALELDPDAEPEPASALAA